MTPLSDPASFLFGSLGGLVAYIAVFAMPELRQMWNDRHKPDFKPPKLWHIALLLGIGVGFVALGGLVAIGLGDATERKHAFFYGAGAEALIGSVFRGTK